jgi:hypothetical protein
MFGKLHPFNIKNNQYNIDVHVPIVILGMSIIDNEVVIIRSAQLVHYCESYLIGHVFC